MSACLCASGMVGVSQPLLCLQSKSLPTASAKQRKKVAASLCIRCTDSGGSVRCVSASASPNISYTCTHTVFLDSMQHLYVKSLS